jgi:putative ABC transport system ATP-binding protein
MASTLQIEGLGKQIHPPDGHWLFRDMHASILEPTVISILGKSGQGKSTLLRILGRLTTPSSGQMLLGGKDSSQWTPEAWRTTVSYVAQQPVMLPGSVEENLRMASFLHQRVFDVKQARQWMEQIGLDHLDWAKPAQ